MGAKVFFGLESIPSLARFDGYFGIIRPSREAVGAARGHSSENGTEEFLSLEF